MFEAIGTETHEEVLFGADRESGLRTIIAIHDTSLGPALGGTRFYPYAMRMPRCATFSASPRG